MYDDWGIETVFEMWIDPATKFFLQLANTWDQLQIMVFLK